jgi:hypothetical protein
MNFERIKVKKQHSYKIILEFDVISDNVDIVKCQKVANSLAASIPSQLLSERHVEVICSKASIQPLPQRTYD